MYYFLCLIHFYQAVNMMIQSGRKMDCCTPSLIITLVVILWYIYAHLSMRKEYFFAWGGAGIDRLKKGIPVYVDAIKVDAIKKAKIAAKQGVVKGVL